MKFCKYIELHLHLDGAIRINTLYELAKESKLYENMSLEEFSDSVSIGNKKYFDSLTHCLTLFNNVLSLIAGNKEYLERIAYEICEDQYNNNVLYTEIRYNPHILKGNIEDVLTSTRILEEILYDHIENNLEYYASYLYIENLFNEKCIDTVIMKDYSFIKKIFKYGFLPVYNYKSILN